VNTREFLSLTRNAKDPLAELTYSWIVASDAGVFGFDSANAADSAEQSSAT
jgi:hypothetical protein